MSVVHQISLALGLDIFSMNTLIYMLIRSIIVYFLGLTLARLNKKMMGIRTPFNFLLFIMLGSVFAAAIIEKKLFLPLLITITFLIFLNGFMTIIAFYIPNFESFIKGTNVHLVKDGKIQWHHMRANFITKRELINELNTQLHTHNLDNIKSAILVSDGSINFIKRDKER